MYSDPRGSMYSFLVKIVSRKHYGLWLFAQDNFWLEKILVTNFLPVKLVMFKV